MAAAQDPLIPTRRSLLSRLKNLDDQESWKDFFDTYARLIYGVAIRAGLSDTEAQEVVQETVIAVSRNIGNFKYDRAKGTFKSWLLHTARWRIADQLRRRRPGAPGFRRERDKTARTATIERIPDPAGPELDAIWDAEWEKHIFEGAIARVKTQIKAKQYQIFDLYVIKQWPVERIVRTLGVSVGQVYLAKYRVTRLLSKEIKALETKAL
ncbi:MAG TPA: sigma-70 family RNA polymerase sigma factor [Verrucomicrobiae bacterium]|nr:sigma-70 family RNA polymerase sigma factor [Verrucomicrobiae bacterium]